MKRLMACTKCGALVFPAKLDGEEVLVDRDPVQVVGKFALVPSQVVTLRPPTLVPSQRPDDERYLLHSETCSEAGKP